MIAQMQTETERLGVGKLEDLLRAGDTWTVGEPALVTG